LLRHLRDPIVSDATQFGGIDQYFAKIGFLFFERVNLLSDVGDLVSRMTIGDWTALRAVERSRKVIEHEP